MKAMNTPRPCAEPVSRWNTGNSTHFRTVLPASHHWGVTAPRRLGRPLQASPPISASFGEREPLPPRRNRDRLEVQITVQSFRPELAPVSAALDAAERREGIHGVALVDAECAGADAGCDRPTT